MNLQPLYDGKERLEQAAIAGTGLLGEDFRLARAAEALKPLAAASPVFGKIDAGLTKLLSAKAEERPGLLLDLLALVDAVAYTQAKTGADGELEPLPAGNGQYQELSYSQLQPLLAALTTTGGGRMEIIQSAWENHPEFFTDFRVLPAVVAGLGDSYGEISELNAKILKQTGPAVLPLLKEGFDPVGKKEMARRVEVISVLEGAEATPWLKEVLPKAKKDVRAAVIEALGADGENTALLLELAQTERGANRDAVLKALSGQDGAEAAAFWKEELNKHPDSVLFLEKTGAGWAGDLIAAGLRQRLEHMLTHGDRVPAAEQEELSRWCQAVGKKACSAMLDFWHWADGHMEEFDRLTNEKGNSVFAGVRLTDTLLDTMRHTGPGPLRDYCLTLFDRRPELTRYLRVSFQAALLSRPAAEVFEKYGSYILTRKPLLDRERKETLNNVLLRALGDVYWNSSQGRHVIVAGQPAVEPLDSRWIARLVRAVCKPDSGRYYPFGGGDAVNGFDKNLAELANPNDPDQCAQLVPYLRERMVETGSWYSYSRYLLRFGGSPGGVLNKAMKKAKVVQLYYTWQLLSEAAKALPAGEVAGLCREALDSERFRPTGNELYLAKTVLPWTIEQLREGKPFPEWAEWWSMRK